METPDEQPSKGIGKYFEKFGIRRKDIAIAFVYFKVVSYFSFMGTLAVCYKFKPIRSFFAWPGPKRFLMRVKGRFPTQYRKTKRAVMSSTQKLSQWRITKAMTRRLGIRSRQFSMALAENIVLYKVMFPVLIPLNFWIVVSILKKPEQESPSLNEYLEGSYDVCNEDMPDNEFTYRRGL